MKAQNQKSSRFAGLTDSELAELIQQYGCGLVRSSGTEEALYERHLGLTAEQVAGSRGSYNPHWHYEDEPETCAALDLIFSNHFSRNEPGIFEPRDALLTHGDYYMHLADLKSQLQADGRLCQLYADSVGWARKAILNIVGSGKFSSDRTIAEYAKQIWNVKPCLIK